MVACPGDVREHKLRNMSSCFTDLYTVGYAAKVPPGGGGAGCLALHMLTRQSCSVEKNINKKVAPRLSHKTFIMSTTAPHEHRIIHCTDARVHNTPPTHTRQTKGKQVVQGVTTVGDKWQLNVTVIKEGR